MSFIIKSNSLLWPEIHFVGSRSPPVHMGMEPLLWKGKLGRSNPPLPSEVVPGLLFIQLHLYCGTSCNSLLPKSLRFPCRKEATCPTIVWITSFVVSQRSLLLCGFSGVGPSAEGSVSTHITEQKEKQPRARRAPTGKLRTTVFALSTFKEVIPQLFLACNFPSWVILTQSNLLSKALCWEQQLLTPSVGPG